MIEKSEIIKRFIEWTKLKARIHFTQRQVFPREREIWWVSLGQNIGVEINGKHENFERPVLVIKRYSLDAFLVGPLSSQSRDNKYCFAIKNKDVCRGDLNFSQVRSISVKRFIRKLGKVDIITFGNIKKKFAELFN